LALFSQTPSTGLGAKQIWLCLALFFSCPEGRYFAIISFHIRAYADFAFRQIGFVFST